MCLAIVMSYLLAYLYDKMGYYSIKNNLETFGGPSFIRSAHGRSSLRYFISRFSMWIANTSLASFSVIYFVDFTFTVIDPLVQSIGFSQLDIDLLSAAIIIFMVVWFIINAFYGKRFIRGIGYTQIGFLIIMVSIIFTDTLDLGFKFSWNLSGLSSFHGNLASAIIMNTGYLFILFFGYQEIQVMERDSKEEGSIPILSQIKHKKYPKTKYLPASMYATIAAAGIIQILYGLAVFSLHANTSSVEQAVIPAIYLASEFQNKMWALMMAFSFLLATVTTFVPAFMAASRHLRSLSEDGIFPRPLASLSWVFTFILILFMSFGGTAFLVNITDFMVLVSLSFVALSAMVLKENSKFDRLSVISLITFLMFMISAISIYMIDRIVVVFGVIALIASFLLYDILRLKLFGLEVLGAFFGTLSLLSTLVMKSSASPSVLIIGNIAVRSPYNLLFLQISVLVLVVILLANAITRYHIERKAIF
ncbi:hypothetical protein [Thermoplasma volcanium GSS1]|uniref:Uncharacterized protein n=1 Tax=Thermoplasma volcanium (strain ATCC 51530 / DSM 4299 / JCM 9571 / NBRC 15438 / GSS1) TaxID=273116 RepID=Q97AK9_THEVO|nr:hypothetical protein [Thermoplasma volcanium GSS1]